MLKADRKSGRAALLALSATAAALLLPMPESAVAAPRIQIRSRAQLSLDPVERVPAGVIVAGRLTDRANGEPIPGARLELTVDENTRETVITDENGEFSRIFPLAEGSHTVAAAFSGDTLRTGTELPGTPFDVAKRPVSLTIRNDASTAGSGEVPVGIIARSDDDPVEIPIRLLGGPADGPLQELGGGTTDPTGRLSLSLPREELGGSGHKQLEARFDGDDTYNPAVAVARLTVRAETILSLDIPESSVAFEDDIELFGQLVEELGSPVSGGRISLELDGQVLKETATDEFGYYRLTIPAAELAAGPAVLQAAFRANRPWLGNSRSPPNTVLISERRPMPVGFTLAAFGITALALMTFVGMRSRPWERWLGGDRPDVRPADPEARKPPQTGLAPARPSLSSSLRRANDFGFSGTTHDAVTGEIIQDAVVTLTHPRAADIHTVTNSLGQFAAEGLSPGPWQVAASAPGYISERFEIGLPHRGSLRQARIDMMPVRERIFELYREVAAGLLPRARLWGVWTPRQIFDHVKSSRLAPALATLTDYVEEKYFSQRLPLEDEIAVAARLVHDARCELPPVEDINARNDRD